MFYVKKEEEEEEKDLKMYDLRLKTPFNSIIAGSSGCGKTVLVYRLLRHRNQLFTTPPAKVFLFYSEMQEIYDNMKNEGVVDELIHGLPTEEKLKQLVQGYKNIGGSVCIFDDSLNDINEEISKIFTVLSHHLFCSVFFLSQSLFFQNKDYRTMSLNCHYMFLMKNPRDNSQIVHIAKQLSPYKIKYVVESFQRATRKAYSYLLLDFHASTPDHLRIKSNLLPHDWPIKVYLEKDAVDENGNEFFSLPISL